MSTQNNNKDSLCHFSYPIAGWRWKKNVLGIDSSPKKTTIPTAEKTPWFSSFERQCQRDKKERQDCFLLTSDFTWYHSINSYFKPRFSSQCAAITHGYLKIFQQAPC
ncbi:hypothetical protein CDAR_195841 [Caerostris darwini]|uniref:Uncharacterized protein n=1 Tax=Caerostris darwini TaxID=1538125 RepID=A0AAV4WQC0_9ARAC|nr:hypothetical protein CDAR_195841 [Caerostris darwini]